MKLPRFWCVVSVVAVLAGGVASAAPAARPVMAGEVRRALAAAAPEEDLSVIVTLRAQADLSSVADASADARLQHVIELLRSTAEETQGPILDLLSLLASRGLVRDVTPFWVFNGIAFTGRPRAVQELANRPDVRAVTMDETLLGPVTEGAGAPEPNVSLVNAPALWDLGFMGAGVVVANMDTGVDAGHPDLAASWRGGANSWFDPNGEHPTVPFDANGHGTQTMGVMVGGSTGGTAIGVAPGARWIAAKIFDDTGVAEVSDVHAGFQWLLDPDGDPGTSDAPDVVSNSWTFGDTACHLDFQLDLTSLRAAGILPVFAAGNLGPGSGTSTSPGNNPEAFAVGATDGSDAIWPGSSRGPSSCGGPSTTFPELVAPGVDVRTADLFGGYATVTGTSLAAPHAAGALALLLQAFPDLTADAQQAALEAGALDLGASGPDATFGHGRLDVLASYDWLEAGGDPPTSLLRFSLEGPGPHTVGTLADVRGEDVVGFDGSSFGLTFDGSDVGLAGFDLDAVAVLDADTLLVSLDRAGVVGGLSADDSDVLRFDATSLGETTAGVFAFYLDGSDVALTTDAEDVDAVEVLADGRVAISTRGRAKVGKLTGENEDLLALTPRALGGTTSGTWAMLFDGSDVGLTADAEDVDAAAIDASGNMWLSTIGDLSVTGLVAFDEDVVRCLPSSLGPVTACAFGPAPVFYGSAWGLGPNDVDAVDAA